MDFSNLIHFVSAKGFSIEELLRRLNLSFRLSFISKQYRVRPINMSVHLFSADNSKSMEKTDNWKKILGAQVIHNKIGGNHITIVKSQKHAEQLGKVISKLLSKDNFKIS